MARVVRLTFGWLIAVGGLSPAAASASFGRWLDPRLGRLEPSLSYAGEGFAADVKGQDDDLTLNRHGATYLQPVWQDETDEVSLTAGLDYLNLDSRARLTDSEIDLPNHFWDASAGGTYRHRFDNAWIAGGFLSVGSASDEPFGTYDELTINLTGLLRIPLGERDAAVFFLNYANNREFLPHVPIPGVGYSWAPSRRFQALVGIPTAWFRWLPLDELTVTGSYFPVRSVDVDVGYAVLPELEVFTGYAWENERYFRAGREDEDDRLFYYEQRATAGIRWKIGGSASVGLSGGYGFQRFFFEGEEYDDRDRNRMSIEDGPFAALEARISF
jgi:hypothetical protein